MYSFTQQYFQIAECDFMSQYTQNICIPFVQRRPFDVGPTLYKCYTNVLCLLRWQPIYFVNHQLTNIDVPFAIFFIFFGFQLLCLETYIR